MSDTPAIIPPLKSIAQLLGIVLSIPSASDEEAQTNLRRILPSASARTREVIQVALGSLNAESFLERRGGGTSLRYILWWLQTHRLYHAEPALTLVLTAALRSGWSLQNAYPHLVHNEEIAQFLPPAPTKRQGGFSSGGIDFFTENNLTIAINCQPKDQFTLAMREGAQVYIWVSAHQVDVRVDGRSGMRLPELPFGWLVLKRSLRSDYSIHCRLLRKATDAEMEEIISLLWTRMDRRWKDGEIPASLGGTQKREQD
jgi:hypothetical protein